MKCLLALAAFLLPACATLGGLTHLDEMDPEAFVRYSARVSTQVQAIAQVAVAEGDLDQEELATVVVILEGVADGSLSLGGLTISQFLDLDGYGALALTIAVTELDARFEERGAYGEDGLLSERARDVLRTVATGLKTLGPVAENGG